MKDGTDQEDLYYYRCYGSNLTYLSTCNTALMFGDFSEKKTIFVRAFTGVIRATWIDNSRYSML